MRERGFHNPAGSLIAALTIALLIVSVSGTAIGASFQLRHTIEFAESQLAFSKQMDYDFIRLDGGYYLTAFGKPALPVRSIKIALPQGMAVQSVHIESSAMSELVGTYSIFPSQPPIELNRSEADIEFIEPDKETYESSDIYPSEIVQSVGQSDLAGQAMAIVEVCPFQYVPATGELTLLTSITLVLEGEDGYVCGDYLPDRISETNARVYQRMLEEMVINPIDVQPSTSPVGNFKASMLPPGGPFDHVIITNASDAPYWEPLAEWHTKKGVRDTIITTAYIYGTYSGADVQEMIRNFVMDAHDNWGTLYFLIGGEHAEVPFKYRSYVSESIPSDAYYADFDDDWELELFVGRVTADNATQIARFIEKLLKYETDPPLTDYPLNATVLGMDLTTEYDPPYYTLTAGEDLKEFIDTSYIPSRFNVTEVYDSHSDNHKQTFIDALNAGQNLVNHCDHSNYSVMGCGDRNHGWYLHSSNVDALYNTGKLSIVFSLGCHPNEMDFNDCIAEHFVIYNDLEAGVAFTGNTRSGWFFVGDPLSLSSELDYVWWEGLFDFNMYRLGETLAYAKNNCQHGSDHWKYCQWTLNLLGEPEMPVWTDTPALLQVSHPTLLPLLSYDFSVHVDEVGIGELAEAYVCLWKNGDIYETGYTDINGDITFSVSPGFDGDMYVTVTKQNYVPYQGATQFTSENIAPTCGTPGDTTVLLCELGELCIPIECSDLDGNLESGPTLIDGPGAIVDGHWCYMPSVEETFTLTVECQDSAGALCQSTFDVTVEFNEPPTCIPPADTTIVQCTPQTVYLFIGNSDPNLNIASLEVISGPGSIMFGSWSYMPPEGNQTVNVTVRCTDDCGEYSDASFQVEFAVNQAPICEGPNDTTVVQCEAGLVSLPVLSYDPEDEEIECEIVTGPGVLADGHWEYTPTGDQTVHVIIKCTDPCGAYCNNSFLATLGVNDAPVFDSSFDTTVVQCLAVEVSMPVPVYDNDDNITEITILDGPGTIIGDNWVYSPSGKDTADVSVSCIDACGEQCEGTFRVVFDVNSAPVCEIPGDTTCKMREPALISIPIGASDEDDNLVGCVITNGPGQIVNGRWEYFPDKSDTANVTIRCTDVCGAFCESAFQVVVMLYMCGDAEGSGAVDIDDVVYLIGYIFSGGIAPLPVESGDANCSGNIDIDDVVYLISYIFSGGELPCADCP